MNLGWLFRRRKPELSIEVKEAQAKRDEVLDELGDAIREVDRGHERLLADYRRANGLRTSRRKP